MRGTVEQIFIAERSGQPMRSVGEVVGAAGRGLIGDRHCRPVDAPPLAAGDRIPDVSLVEAEVLESLRADHAIEFGPSETRRNILTRGVRLNDLVGQQFRLGGLLCEGVEICEPCIHVQRKVGKPILKPLVHRGGLRARIVASGIVRVGDAIEAVEVHTTA
jgi:MOSC domain-containing protein YiiM